LLFHRLAAIAMSLDQMQDGCRNGWGQAPDRAIEHPAPRDFKLPTISPSDPAGVAVQLFVAVGYHRIQAMEEPARGGEVEGVHRLRTATRRLRSDLRTVQSLLDPGWADSLGGELKWLGGLLGAVRDLDVLSARLAKAAGDTAPALTPLFDAFTERHDQATTALRDGLRSSRYTELVARLAEAAERTPLADEAAEPCRTALPPLAERAWDRLKRPARRIVADSPDEDLHEVRKRAKRARYAAEAVSVALGHPDSEDASRFARRATDLQDVLGEHQDAVVACGEIQKVVEAHCDNGPFSFAAGRLLERQAVAADAARQDFFNVWDRLDRKKHRRWLKK